MPAPAVTPLHTLVVGLGRAGLGLHIPVVRRLGLSAGPVLAVDPYRTPPAAGAQPLGAGATPVLVGSLRAARARLDPERTVVHLCTPPAVRAEMLAEVAGLGFTAVIVEKPLATGEGELAEILRLVRRHGLRLRVVAPWLDSTLTGRLVELVRGGTLGRLLAVGITQHKPRFARTLAAPSHTSAFDVEVPHALGLALRLAGDAAVTTAEARDLRLGDTLVPGMGGAALTLAHRPGGVRTTVVSDLTSPVRRRRAVLRLTAGHVVADYPISEDDDHAQLRVVGAAGAPRGGAAQHHVFPDDALGRCLARAYHQYASGADGPAEEFAEHVRGCRLLLEAKRRAARAVIAPVPVPYGTWRTHRDHLR